MAPLEAPDDRFGEEARRPIRQQTVPTIPRWLLVAGVLLWLALLPANALLEEYETLTGRIARAVAGATSGALFPLVVGALILDRFRQRQRRAALEHDRNMWAARTKHLVIALAEEVRWNLAELVTVTYGVLSRSDREDEVIRSDHLENEIRRESGSTIRGMLGPRLDGPLATAVRQAAEGWDRLRSQFWECAGIEAEDARIESTTRRPKLSSAELQTFLERAAAVRSQIISLSLAIYALVDEFDRQQPETRPDLLGGAVRLRQAGRRWERVFHRQRSGLPRDDCELAGLSVEIASAASTILSGAESLVRALWDTEGGLKRRLEPTMDWFDRSIEEARQSHSLVQRFLWEIDRPTAEEDESS
jgi:hypothetical protein